MRLEKSGTSTIGPGGLKRLRRSKNCGSLRFDFLDTRASLGLLSDDEKSFLLRNF